MINLHERMLPTSAGVEPATSWSPVRRRIQLSHRGRQHLIWVYTVCKGLSDIQIPCSNSQIVDSIEIWPQYSWIAKDLIPKRIHTCQHNSDISGCDPFLKNKEPSLNKNHKKGSLSCMPMMKLYLCLPTMALVSTCRNGVYCRQNWWPVILRGSWLIAKNMRNYFLQILPGSLRVKYACK